jgi:hypothetical protein
MVDWISFGVIFYGALGDLLELGKLIDYISFGSPKIIIS